mgnify:CR=1 FL=1
MIKNSEFKENSEKESVNIPKYIHMIWVGNKPIPDIYQKCIKIWKEMHPDFKFKLWKNEDLTEDNFPSIFKYLKKCQCPAQMADIMRIEIIYRNGGIYLDCDIKPIKKLNNILRMGSLVVCNESTNNNVMSTGFFASCSYHPAMKAYLELLQTVDWKNKKINEQTGPYRWMEALTKSKSKYIKLPIKAFYSVPFRPGVRNIKQIFSMTYNDPYIYGVHMWGKSW